MDGQMWIFFTMALLPSPRGHGGCRCPNVDLGHAGRRVSQPTSRGGDQAIEGGARTLQAEAGLGMPGVQATTGMGQSGTRVARPGEPGSRTSPGENSPDPKILEQRVGSSMYPWQVWASWARARLANGAHSKIARAKPRTGSG